jgi:hypothetical protein
MKKPKDTLVASINLHLNMQIKEDLKELASFQAQDLRIEGIKLKLSTQPNLSEKYLLKGGICIVRTIKPILIGDLNFPLD